MANQSVDRGGNGTIMAEREAEHAGESVLAGGIRDLATRLDRLIRDFKAGAVPVAEVVARLYELELEIARLRGDRS
jgi:hypothetical protein